MKITYTCQRLYFINCFLIRSHLKFSVYMFLQFSCLASEVFPSLNKEINRGQLCISAVTHSINPRVCMCGGGRSEHT